MARTSKKTVIDEVSPAIVVTQPPAEMLTRIGHVTRSLHDSLRDLGLEKLIDKVASEIPDARDRLSYVAKMTEQAAERVLNATDLASPLQTGILNGGIALEKYWRELLENPSLKSEYNEVAQKTLEFIEISNKNSTETKALLLEIMMAQDFQDLTGQVIKKITVIAQELESQLVNLLVDFSPQTVKKENGLLNGPQIDKSAPNVAANQEQVDDLLDSLGF